MNRPEMTVLGRSDLTHAQHVALSNTICGDVQATRELEQMGLVVIREMTLIREQAVAFFDLSEQSDCFVRQHYVIRTSR